MVDPTIDRKDNDGDYTFDNCQYLERWENTLKSNKKDYVSTPFNESCYENWMIT
jgi:hypothetical protein